MMLHEALSEWHTEGFDGDDVVQATMARYLAGLGRLSWSEVHQVEAGISSRDFDALMTRAQADSIRTPASHPGASLHSRPLVREPLRASELNAAGVRPSALTPMT